MKRLLYIILSSLLLTACGDEENIIDPAAGAGSELRSISATIGESLTRASGNSDYVGRQRFINKDIMVLTKMARTTFPLPQFSYENIRFVSNAEQAWDRDMKAGFYEKDRIYWSDNASPHTFIGYSTPSAWLNVDGSLKSTDKWAYDETTKYYTGHFTKDADNVVDFSADPIPAGKKIDETGQKLKDEDILLAYNTNMHADPGGLTTTVHFRHALASLRVIIDINAFAPSASSLDTLTMISDLKVLEQPWKYIWKQMPNNSDPVIKNDGWGVENNTQESDGKVTIKAWQPRPDGEGYSQGKRFTFYSLIVPSEQTNFSVKYKVNYPKATNPAETVDKTYKATIASIKFLPGYCTTLKVSLNHEGEPINIGAEYIDWENVETPDRSELQKVSTFLDIVNRKNGSDILVSVANDKVNGANISVDDATWLYIDAKDGNKLKDIYGNDGSKERPYQIKSARQFLSFAYEVNESGRTFENLYIKLETGLYLQGSTTAGEKKNSENLFVERWYQLLRENGRLSAVLPESVFDTTENKYIRLFLYKYFKIKAVVSLPQLAFEPYTSTKTSILFAQKKTAEEVAAWNTAWDEASKEWQTLKTRVENLIAVADGTKEKAKLPSIKNLTADEETALIKKMLKAYITERDNGLSAAQLISKYRSELEALCAFDKDTQDTFGHVNTWWVFGEVSSLLDYDVFMAEAENIGYKRYKKNKTVTDKIMPNELYRSKADGSIIFDDDKYDSILDFMRAIEWN